MIEYMKALITGSFDPITLGHMDIIKRTAALFDEVIVGIFTNSSKRYLISEDDRLALIKEAVKDLENVKAELCSGLVSSYARDHGIRVIVKGIRNVRDYDYELEMAGVNRMLCQNCETLLMPASPSVQLYSSTMVRILYQNGDDISAYVPECVTKFLNKTKTTQ